MYRMGSLVLAWPLGAVSRRRTRAVAVAALAALATCVAALLPSSALAAPACTTDPFDGDALGSRWEVRNPGPGLSVAGGRLGIEMTNSDLINGTTSAQNVPLTELPPAAGWIASTRFSITEVNANGEQAGLALWRDGTTFAKVTFIQNNSGARGFEFITTEGGQQAIPIANSFVAIPAGLPADADVSIRLRSDNREVVAEYSVDGATGWTKIGQTWRVTGAMKAGPLALRGGTGGGAVQFDSFSLLCGDPVTLQADKVRGVAPLAVAYDGDAADGATLAWDFGDGATATGEEDRSHTFAEPGTFRTTLSATNADGVTTTTAATVTSQAEAAQCPIQSDEFRGNALRPRWQVLRPTATGLEVSGGALRLKPYSGDMHGTNASVRNLLLQTMPAAAWTATLKVDVSGLTNSGQTGLVVWRGESPNDFAKVVFNKRSTTNYWVERQNNIGGVTQAGGGNAGENANPPATILIRVTSDGTGPNPLISAAYSINGGTDWIGVRDPFRLGGAGAIKLGPAYWGGPGASTAVFDSFVVASTCDGADRTPPVTTHAYAPAANDNGWLRNGTVTLSANDPSPLDASPFEDPLASETSGVDKTEYRLDGAQEWTTYTTPVAVSGSGSHTLEYRSVDEAGNSEAPRTATFKLDGDAPQTTATLDPGDPGAGGTYAGPVDVTLAAQDAVSGVAKTEYRVDGGEWQPYGPPAETIYDGTQAARDKWVMAGPGDFVRQPDGALQTSGGLGMLWYPEQQYGDFSLTFEWREARTDGGDSNGGVFARFPDPRTPAGERGSWGACNTGSATTQPAWVAIFCGHEFQIYDGPGGEVQKTGSVYNFQPVGLAQAQPSPRGEWNTYELRAVGQMFWILRNGKVINQFDNGVDKASSRVGDPPTQARRFPAGYIGLQNHGNADLLQYRNVRITELEPAKGEFTVAGEGDHVVEFRSTDYAGNVEATDSVEFAIDAPSETFCTTDPFDGTALDDARWDVLNPGAGLTVANGKLGLELVQGDLFQNTATARNVVLQELPADTGWTITTRLNTAGVNANGEQAGLALYKSQGPPNSANVYAKATFIQTNAGTRGFEFIPTDGGQLPIPTGESFVPAPAGLPADADVSVRLRSDGEVVVAEYSVDGTTGWTQMGKAFEVSGAMKAGPYAVRGAAGGGVVEFDSVTLDCGPAVALEGDKTTGTAPLTVAFDGEAPDGAALAWTFGDGTTETGLEDRTHTFAQPGTYRVTLTATGANGVRTTAAHLLTVAPSTPPCPVQSDDFNGNALDPKWEVLRPSATSLDVAGGNLRLTPFGGDMHGTNANVRNLLLQTMPSGAWTATTKIDVSQLTSQGDQTGLVVWRGEAPNNFAKVVFNRRQNAPGTNYWFERQNNVDGVTQGGGGDAGTLSNPPAGGVYIRVSSDGAANPSISAAYSLDGTAWVGVRDPFQLGGSGPIKVGPAYWRASATTVAAFDWFRVTSPACEEEPGDTTAPTTGHALAPAAPDGSGGWYRTAPQVSLAATDEAGGSGVARTEYRVDGAATWTAYTAPFAAPAGSHTIEYRSADVAGNVETAKSVAVKVDATAPTTTLATAPATPQGQNGWFTTAPQVTLTGTDNGGGSGLSSREYRIDGGAWTAYTAAFAAPAGSHTIEYRSTDAAGNTGTAGSATVKVDTAAPTVTAGVAPGEPNGNDGWFVAKPELTLTGADGDGSGIARVEYRVGGGDWTAYSAPVELPDGTRTVTYRAIDNAGIASADASRTFKVDTVAPTTTPKAAPTGGATAPVVLTATATDAAPGSGVAGTEIRVDGGQWTPYTAAVAVLAPGEHTAEFRSTDVAGNVEAARAVAFTIAAPAGPSGENPPPPGPQPTATIDRADGLGITAFRRSGLTVQVSCSLVDGGRISLSVTKRVARKLKLHGTRTLAAADVRCESGGTMTVYLQPGKKVRKALAKSKGSVKATLTLRMGAVRDSAAVVLRKGR
jgi:PKD repeat protein